MAFHWKYLTFSKFIQWITKIKLQITPIFFNWKLHIHTWEQRGITLYTRRRPLALWFWIKTFLKRMGLAAILDMLPGPQNWTNSYSPTLRGLHIKFELICPSDFRGCLKMLINAEGLTLDWLQSLKQFFINVSYHILKASLTDGPVKTEQILVASQTLMALFSQSHHHS